ncbi:hypothetical protein [Paenibacillus selenitireducens]|nr:hypothetical protein [Paenibacillus selenitireducens]
MKTSKANAAHYLWGDNCDGWRDATLEFLVISQPTTRGDRTPCE